MPPVVMNIDGKKPGLMDMGVSLYKKLFLRKGSPTVGLDNIESHPGAYKLVSESPSFPTLTANQRSRTNTHTNTESDVYSCLEGEVENFVGDYKSWGFENFGNRIPGLAKMRSKIRNTDLQRHEWTFLQNKIQEGFDRVDELREEVKLYLDSETEKYESEKQEYKGRAFSELELSVDETNLKPKNPREKDKNATQLSTDLSPMLEVYPHIFGEDSEFRSQQVQYMSMCYEAVVNNSDIIIEGPTGLGKTRALLASTLPEILKDSNVKIAYTTRTNTQVDNVIGEIKKVVEGNDVMEGISGTVFMGANRVKKLICDPESGDGNGDKSCNSCSEDLKKKRFKKIENLDELQVIDTDLLGEVRRREECPLPYFRQKVEDAQIVVFNHNYLYDSHWMHKNILNRGSKNILIVDEAHNLLDELSSKPYLTLTRENEGSNSGAFAAGEDRMNNNYSLEHIVSRSEEFFRRHFLDISSEDVPMRKAFSFLRNLESEVFSSVEKCSTEENFVDGQPEGKPGYHLIAENDMFELSKNIGDSFRERLSSLGRLFEDYRGKIREKSGFQIRKIEPSIYSALQIIKSLEDISSNPYDFFTKVDNGRIEFFSNHPKRRLEQLVDGFDSRIFTSATLSPVEDVASLFGMNDALTSKIESVFSPDNYLPFIVTGINSAKKKDEENSSFVPREKEVLRDLFRSAIPSAQGRNIGIFCSSNPVLLDTYSILDELRGEIDFDILVHVGELGSNINPEYRSRIMSVRDDHSSLSGLVGLGGEGSRDPNSKIELFKKMADIDRTTLLLGVQGGTLSEGIDYKGKEMEMEIAVGLPYPGSAGERGINRIRSNYFYMQSGDKEFGEDLAYRHAAFRKLAQSLGRVHRKMSDKGVLIIADERMASIKNTMGEHGGNYEYLSPFNTKAHLEILQGPIGQKKQIVFSPKHNTTDRVLKNYISSNISPSSTFIDYDQMAEQIRGFLK